MLQPNNNRRSRIRFIPLLLALVFLMTPMFSMIVFADADSELARKKASETFERKAELYNSIVGIEFTDSSTSVIKVHIEQNTGYEIEVRDEGPFSSLEEAQKRAEELEKLDGYTVSVQQGAMIDAEETTTRKIVNTIIDFCDKYEVDSDIRTELTGLVDGLYKSEDFFASVYNLLNKWFGSGGGTFAKIFNDSVASLIYGSVVIIGILLVIIYFFMDLTEMMETRNLSDEKLVFMILRLILGIGLIKYSKLIVEYVISLGFWLFEATGAKIGSGEFSHSMERIATVISDTYYSLQSRMDMNIMYEIRGLDTGNTGSGFLDSILELISNAYFLEIALDLAAFKIIVELALRIAFSPISIAELCFDNRRGNSIRALKQLLVCALQPTAILVVLSVLEMIKTSGGELSVIAVAALNMTILTAAFTVQPIMNSILGV